MRRWNFNSPRSMTPTFNCTARCGWCPRQGWTVDTDELPFMLPPGERIEANVALAIPRGAVQGLYPVRAELAVTAASVPASWRQTVEDVCVVSVGATDDRVLRLVTDPEPVEVAVGQQATLGVTVANDTHGALSIEAHLITPWETWEWIGADIIRADVPARGTLALRVRRRAAGMGRAWAVVGARQGRLRGRPDLLACGRR